MNRAQGRLYTWANLLTGVRLAAIPVSVWAVIYAQWNTALIVFVFAAVTDLLDGPVARRLNEASPLGGLFDHATDAAFVTCTLAACAAYHVVPWPLVFLIPAAFLQYTFDSHVLAGQSLRTSSLGRINGIAYFVLTGTVVVREGVGLSWPPLALVNAFGWLLVISTLLSMADRWEPWRRLRAH